MLQARSKERGARIGAAWGEGYRRRGPQPIRDPLELLEGASAATWGRSPA
jgi:hypothetical protein